MRLAASVLALALAGTSARAISWPIPPVDSVHPIGHTWGNYINFGSGNFHAAVDIMTLDQPDVPVIAVAPGWVKAWGTNGGREFWNLATSDSSPDFTGRAPGWQYTHIDPDRPHKQLGDPVETGDTLGYVVNWFVPGFDHLHFARISDTGAYWSRFPNQTWWTIENPLLTMEPVWDTVAPAFRDALPSQRFAFCTDETGSYLQPDSLRGDIDIVARVHDLTGLTSHTAWDTVAPYQLEYCILDSARTAVVPWTLAVQFSNLLDRPDVYVVYKYDATCRSYGDYTRRDYFFTVSNTDGDSIIEAGDRAGCWPTAAFPDGLYQVLVRVADAVGNVALDSMAVRVRNAGAIAEQESVRGYYPLSVSPNPGRGPARVSFGIGKPARVRLRVLDAAGRVAARPVDGRLPPGEHVFRDLGLNPGVYLVELTLNGDDRYSTKLVLAR